ncbi:cytochrome P450 [Trametes maxima]|nr:cytochrome P450 [Trametes maxima]
MTPHQSSRKSTLPYYLLTVQYHRNAFSTLEKAPHAELKRRFAERHNKTHIMRPEVISAVEDVVETFVAKCTGNAGHAVDIYALLHCYSLDGVTGHMFNPNGLHSLTEPRDFAMMKQLTYPSLSKEQYLREGLNAANYVPETVRKTEVVSHTLAHKLRLYQPVDPDLKLAASECRDHLVAGLDTTGDALYFLMHHISLPTSRPIQERLHAELASNPSAPVDDLPYLDALVKEGLRVLRPVPMSLPRVVPPGRSVIEGVHLPGGTILPNDASKTFPARLSYFTMTFVSLLHAGGETLVLALLSVTLYRLFLAPLARLPGPKVCALTRLPLMLREFSGGRRLWIHQLHLKYGPVVRIAPDEISFATREAVKEIYTSGGSGYDKPASYELFSHFDTPSEHVFNSEKG